MRTTLGLISLLCFIISGLLIISIPFIGLFKVFSLFPEWVYVILFLGVVIPYMARENEKADALNKQTQGRKEPVEVPKAEPVTQPPSRFDANVEYLTVQTVKDTGTVSETLRVNPFIVAADDSGSLIGEYEEGQIIKGYIKLCQQKNRYDLMSNTKEELDTRYAYVSGSIKELSELLEKHNLSIGSQIAGRIILVESLFRSWKGQKAKVDENTGKTVGFTFEGRFYPVYARYHFTEDVNARDDGMNYFKAKYCFRDYDLKPGDILPSFV